MRLLVIEDERDLCEDIAKKLRSFRLPQKTRWQT